MCVCIALHYLIQRPLGKLFTTIAITLKWAKQNLLSSHLACACLPVCLPVFNNAQQLLYCPSCVHCRNCVRKTTPCAGEIEFNPKRLNSTPHNSKKRCLTLLSRAQILSSTSLLLKVIVQIFLILNYNKILKRKWARISLEW